MRREGVEVRTASFPETAFFEAEGEGFGGGGEGEDEGEVFVGEGIGECGWWHCEEGMLMD